jgi:hypothetical protein
MNQYSSQTEFNLNSGVEICGPMDTSTSHYDVNTGHVRNLHRALKMERD